MPNKRFSIYHSSAFGTSWRRSEMPYVLKLYITHFSIWNKRDETKTSYIRYLFFAFFSYIYISIYAIRAHIHLKTRNSVCFYFLYIWYGVTSRIKKLLTEWLLIDSATTVIESRSNESRLYFEPLLNISCYLVVTGFYWICFAYSLIPMLSLKIRASFVHGTFTIFCRHFFSCYWCVFVYFRDFAFLFLFHFVFVFGPVFIRSLWMLSVSFILMTVFILFIYIYLFIFVSDWNRRK